MKRIDLKNGYAIDRPDKRNFELKHWEKVKVKVTDENGDFVKIQNKDGKEVVKTITEYQWVWCGYYGNIKSLLNGMVNHKCHVEDKNTLTAILESVNGILETLDVDKLEAMLVE